MHKPISKNPLITALAAEYAIQIKELKDGDQSQIALLYKEFTWKYHCLKRTIEALDNSSADSMDNSSAPITRIS